MKLCIRNVVLYAKLLFRNKRINYAGYVEIMLIFIFDCLTTNLLSNLKSMFF